MDGSNVLLGILVGIGGPILIGALVLWAIAAGGRSIFGIAARRGLPGPLALPVAIGVTGLIVFCVTFVPVFGEAVLYVVFMVGALLSLPLVYMGSEMPGSAAQVALVFVFWSLIATVIYSMFWLITTRAKGS